MKRAITLGSWGLLCVVAMGCNEDPTATPRRFFGYRLGVLDPFDYGAPDLDVTGTQGGGGTLEGLNLYGQMDLATADWTASDHYTGVKLGASELHLTVNRVSGSGNVSGQCRIEPPLGVTMRVSADSAVAGRGGWYSPATGAVATVLSRK